MSYALLTNFDKNVIEFCKPYQKILIRTLWLITKMNYDFIESEIKDCERFDFLVRNNVAWWQGLGLIWDGIEGSISGEIHARKYGEVRAIFKSELIPSANPME